MKSINWTEKPDQPSSELEAVDEDAIPTLELPQVTAEEKQHLEARRVRQDTPRYDTAEHRVLKVMAARYARYTDG